MVHDWPEGTEAHTGHWEIRRASEAFCFCCCYFSSVIGRHWRAISYPFLLLTVWTSILSTISFLTFKRLRLNSGLRLNFQEIPLDDQILSANLNVPQYYMNNQSNWPVTFPPIGLRGIQNIENLITNSSFWNSLKIWYLTIFSICYLTVLFSVYTFLEIYHENWCFWIEFYQF